MKRRYAILKPSSCREPRKRVGQPLISTAQKQAGLPVPQKKMDWRTGISLGAKLGDGIGPDGYHRRL